MAQSIFCHYGPASIAYAMHTACNCRGAHTQKYCTLRCAALDESKGIFIHNKYNKFVVCGAVILSWLSSPKLELLVLDRQHLLALWIYVNWPENFIKKVKIYVVDESIVPLSTHRHIATWFRECESDDGSVATERCIAVELHFCGWMSVTVAHQSRMHSVCKLSIAAHVRMRLEQARKLSWCIAALLPVTSLVHSTAQHGCIQMCLCQCWVITLLLFWAIGVRPARPAKCIRQDDDCGSVMQTAPPTATSRRVIAHTQNGESIVPPSHRFIARFLLLVACQARCWQC